MYLCVVWLEGWVIYLLLAVLQRKRGRTSISQSCVIVSSFGLVGSNSFYDQKKKKKNCLVGWPFELYPFSLFLCFCTPCVFPFCFSFEQNAIVMYAKSLNHLEVHCSIMAYTSHKMKWPCSHKNIDCITGEVWNSCGCGCKCILMVIVVSLLAWPGNGMPIRTNEFVSVLLKV